jgi:hypothetical protein
LSRCSRPAGLGLGVEEGGELDELVGAAAGAADDALEGGLALGFGEGLEGLVPALTRAAMRSLRRARACRRRR